MLWISRRWCRWSARESYQKYRWICVPRSINGSVRYTHWLWNLTSPRRPNALQRVSNQWKRRISRRHFWRRSTIPVTWASCITKCKRKTSCRFGSSEGLVWSISVQWCMNEKRRGMLLWSLCNNERHSRRWRIPYTGRSVGQQATHLSSNVTLLVLYLADQPSFTPKIWQVR